MYRQDGYDLFSMRIQIEETAKIIAALTQVFEGLSEYFFVKGTRSFALDPGYKFTRLLAWHYSLDEMKAT